MLHATTQYLSPNNPGLLFERAVSHVRDRKWLKKESQKQHPKGKL